MVHQPKLDMPFVGIPSFCRFPVCTELSELDADVAILGIPYDFGGSYLPGQRFAPRKIRESSMRLAPRGEAPGGFFDIETGEVLLEREIRAQRIKDCGDVDVLYTRLPETFDVITRDVRAILERRAFPVCFGGDHSVSFPIILAFDAEPLDIVIIDAHLDFTDSAVGVTHAGMNPFRRCAELPNVRNIVHVGVHGFRNSKHAYEEATSNGNTIITVSDIRKVGVEASLSRVESLDNVYLSIDIDGLDPSVAPGCSAVDPGGLSYHEVLEIMRAVTHRAGLVGFDITEVNPTVDVSDITSNLAAMLAVRFLGFATAAPHWRKQR